MTASTVAGQAETLLEARGLARHYRARRGFFSPEVTVRALDGVSLELHPGEIFGIVGESGCGKSTLARLLVNIEPPSRGEVAYRGRVVSGLGRKAWRPLRRHIQIAFQDTRRSLDPRARIIEQVREPLDIHAIGEPAERKARSEAILREFGLEAHLWRRFPHEISGGQCQRVVLARAMILEPEILICDEPTSAADVSVQAQVVGLLRELRARTGVAILFISHNLGLVKYLCDRVAVMYLGEIVEVAARKDLFADPQHPYTKALLAAVPIAHPSAKGREPTLAGEPPSPANPPPGCRFHPRCALAAGLCRNARPDLKPLADDGWKVACHVVQGDVAARAD
ncbi:MAG: dipeptide ABC transporter ATP-binding protein [Rhodospirillales bacterium]